MICFDLNMISNKAKADLALITAGFNTVEAADLWCVILSPLFTSAFWCHGNKAVLFLFFFQKMLNQNRCLEEQKGFDCTTANDSVSEFWLAGPAANLTLHQNNWKPHFPHFKDKLNTCSDKLRQQLCLSQLWKELHKRLLKVEISVFQFYFTITELVVKHKQVWPCQILVWHRSSDSHWPSVNTSNLTLRRWIHFSELCK